MKSFKEFLSEDRWYDEPEYVNFGNAQIRQLYGALQSAEHRGHKFKTRYGYDPETFIRTKAAVVHNKKTGKDDVSTAYGPVQITRSTAAGFIKTQPELFKGQEEYTSRYLDQGKKMLANKGYGANKQYGAGGAGDLSGEEQHSGYQQMAGGVIRGKLKELNIDPLKPISTEDRERFVKSWRGRSREADPEYYKAVDQFLSGQ